MSHHHAALIALSRSLLLCQGSSRFLSLALSCHVTAPLTLSRYVTALFALSRYIAALLALSRYITARRLSLSLSEGEREEP